MKFFATLKQSFTDLSAYLLFLTYPLTDSVMFVVKFYAIIGIVLFLLIFPASYVSTSLLSSSFPDNLSFHLEKGIVTTQGQQLPIEYSLEKIHFMEKTHVRVQEKELTITVNNIPTSLVYTDAFPETANVTINKDSVKQHGQAAFIGLFLSFLVFFGIFTLIARTISIVLYSAFLYFVSQFSGLRLPYKKFIQLGIHANVTAEITTLLYFVVYRSTAFPMHDIAFIGICILVLWRLKTKSFV